MGAIGIDELDKLMRRGDYAHLYPDGSVVIAERNSLKQSYEELIVKYEAIESELRRVKTLLDTPEIEDFDKAVPLEAAHQVKRWGSEHDQGKNPEDWFWLLGYLAGKALASFKAGNMDKAKHHCISTAAALRNWHAHIRSGQSVMRPGIEEPHVS